MPSKIIPGLEIANTIFTQAEFENDQLISFHKCIQTGGLQTIMNSAFSNKIAIQA